MDVPTLTDEPAPAVALAAICMSAGGTAPLRTLLGSLPANFPGALIVARHTAVSRILPDLMRCWTKQPVLEAESGMRLDSGTIYVCPGQRHLIVNPDGTIGLSNKDRIAFVRPSFDWMFESVAAAYGARATAILLSGANSDGAQGAQAIQRAGGMVLVQDPKTCEYPRMPLAALQTGAVSALLAPEHMGVMLFGRMASVNHQYANAWLDPFSCLSIAAG